MLLTVNRKFLDHNPTISPHFYAEASCLDLKPGEWPDFIAVVDGEGSGFLLQRGRGMWQGDGEFRGYHYVTRQGEVELVVFND